MTTLATSSQQLPSYREVHLLRQLGWVDLNLESSPSWWAAIVATYCPGKMAEHPNYKSTQPNCFSSWTSLYAEHLLLNTKNSRKLSLKINARSTRPRLPGCSASSARRSQTSTLSANLCSSDSSAVTPRRSLRSAGRGPNTCYPAPAKVRSIYNENQRIQSGITFRLAINEACNRSTQNS